MRIQTLTAERRRYLARFDVALESAESAEPCSCLLLFTKLRLLNEMAWADSFAIALTMARVHATEAMAIITCLSNVDVGRRRAAAFPKGRTACKPASTWESMPPPQLSILLEY